MSAMPFVLIDAPAAAPRRALLALRLRQAELRLRAASMKAYAARLEIDAEAIELMLDDEPATLPQLELVNAQQDAARFALEAEWLRKEIAA